MSWAWEAPIILCTTGNIFGPFLLIEFHQVWSLQKYIFGIKCEQICSKELFYCLYKHLERNGLKIWTDLHICEIWRSFVYKCRKGAGFENTMPVLSVFLPKHHTPCCQCTYVMFKVFLIGRPFRQYILYIHWIVK